MMPSHAESGIPFVPLRWFALEICIILPFMLGFD
jgi:hypothetical protein